MRHFTKLALILGLLSIMACNKPNTTMLKDYRLKENWKEIYSVNELSEKEIELFDRYFSSLDFTCNVGDMAIKEEKGIEVYKSNDITLLKIDGKDTECKIGNKSMKVLGQYVSYKDNDMEYTTHIDPKTGEMSFVSFTIDKKNFDINTQPMYDISKEKASKKGTIKKTPMFYEYKPDFLIPQYEKDGKLHSD